MHRRASFFLLWFIYVSDQNSNMMSFLLNTEKLNSNIFNFYPSKNRRKAMGVRFCRTHQDASFEHHAGSVGPQNVWVFYLQTQNDILVFLMLTHHMLHMFLNCLDEILDLVGAQLFLFNVFCLSSHLPWTFWTNLAKIFCFKCLWIFGPWQGHSTGNVLYI